MAHKKAGGSKANQGVDVKGKRLGLKVASGEFVHQGTILVRQRGTRYLPGRFVGVGRDHTLFAKTDGRVQFKNATKPKGGRKVVFITPESNRSK